MNTHITKLTLQGFKSFNRKISIPFLPGFNVITGPNGSGKSNLADSISFVLGRVSAKSLRAGRLKELIFHGSQKKRPAEQASVTVYFDNSNGAFPLDTKEVSITRKINKKGVSIYKLNGRTTTREKILEILSAVRLRPTGYNLIQQGDVARVIEMNPIERRLIIDEISGIAEYNQKKERAMRDLEAVDQKLKEAEIIITQRYEIFKRLEAERNAALRYRNLQRQLRTLKASYLAKKSELLDEKLRDLEYKIALRKEKSEKVSKKLEEVEAKLDGMESALRDIVKKLIEMSKRVRVERQVSQIRSRLLVVRDKVDLKRGEVARLENLIEKLEAIEIKKTELAEEMPRAVRSILSLGLMGVYGTLAQLISVPEEYRVAVEVAAGWHLHDLVVENEDTASYCIEYLKREKIGRATFLPLNKIRPRIFSDPGLLSKEGVIGIASKLIRFKTKFMNAVEFVLGNTLVVRDLEAARLVGIGKARMVTLDGDLIEKSGAITGGYYLRTHPKALEDATRKEIEQYRKMRLELLREIEKLKSEAKRLEERLARLSKSEETKELIDLEKLKIASEREVENLRKKRKVLQERKISLEMEINRLKIEKAKVETELETVSQELSKYEGVEVIEDKLKNLEDFIKRTAKELESIGPVNFKAIDEFERFKAEFEGYKQKYEKILEEKRAVLKMIDEIEQKRREVFYRTLEAVSNEFNSVFSRIMGGTASIRLEDPNDLESGLVIEANPPGKRLISIDAMSGGEKALTALIFLFALQRYRPSPFYILDEIDAALDKENTQKIAEWIKRMSKHSQFIIISHNDLTLKLADRLYGVTMEDGESKILSLELPRE